VIGEKALQGKYLPEAALAYVKTSQPAKALPMYKLRLEREAQKLGLLDTLCNLFGKTGDDQGRVSMLEAAVALDPTFKDYQLQLAKAKEKAKDTVAAIDHYGQWTARNTTDVEALKSMHRLAQAKQDTTSMEAALGLLVEIKGQDLEYSYQLAEIQFKFTGEPSEIIKLVKAHNDYHRGKIILAKEYFRRFDIAKMIPYEKALASEAIKDPELNGALAELYAYQNKKSLANKAFRDNLIFRAGRVKSSGSPLVADLRPAFEKAWLYGEANKSEFQTEVLEIGNGLFPGEPPIQHALALSLGKNPRALDLYKQILDKDGNDLTALRNASELAMALGKFPEAVTWLERWSNIEPGTIRNWQLLAEAYGQVKDLVKMADALDHLTLISPTDAALAYRTGKAYLEAKNREKALEFFIRADELKPKDPAYVFEVMDLLQVMTETFLSKGQVSKAIELYSLLLDREPKHKKANLYIGMWLAENQDFASAGNMLKLGMDQSSEPRPILAKAWRLLGNCHAGRGESQPALDAYKRALNLDPTDKLAATSRLDLTRALNLSAEVPAALSEVVRLDSANVDAGMELAEIHLKEGNFLPAAALFRRATLAHDSEPDVWGRYGEALEGAKQNTAALAAWEKAFKLGDRTPYNLHGMARLYRDAGSLAKAETALDELVVLQPENDEASSWLAELALSKNRLEKAEEMFAQAAQAAPDKIEYTQGLAEVYLRRGDAESALEILDPVRGRLNASGRLTYADGLRMVGKPELSIALYQEVGAKEPSSRVLIGLAEANLDRNKPDEAKKAIEASQFQKDPEVKLRLGKAFLALHEKDKAATIFQALVQENKANPFYLLALAQVHFQQKKNSLALKEFSEALQKRADLAPAAFGVGMVLVSNGQLNEGKNYFYALAQSLSKSERVLGLRGLAAASAGEQKLSEASDYLVQAVEIYPTSEALAELSQISLKLGRLQEAEESAQKSLEADEDFSEGIVALAEVMMAQGHKAEAHDYLKEGLGRNPRACEIHLEYSKVLFAMENFQGLTTSSRQVMSLCPEEPLSYYYAGVGADRSYQKKQAEDYFKSYKKLGGDKTVLPKGY
jgi:tetratricopeptide (TPR) repeat protein